MRRCGFVLAGLGVLLCSCSSADWAGRPRPWVSQDEITDALATSTNASVEKGSSTAPTSNSPTDIVRAYMAAAGPDNAGLRQELRNQYLVSSILLIDAEYDRFVQTHGAMRKGGDTFTQTAAVILSASSAAFSPEVTKTVLSILAASIVAGNTAITKNYFYEQALPMLLKQMEADRKEALLAILRSHGKNDGEYPLVAAHGQLREFYHAGTFECAFSKLDQAASRNKEEADAATKRFATASPALSIQRWLSEPQDQTDRNARSTTLGDAIKAVDAPGLQQAGSPLVWLFRASDDQLKAVAEKVGAPSVSEAEVLAQQAASRQQVESLVERRAKARDQVVKLATAGKLEEARAMVTKTILEVNEQPKPPDEVMDPIVNAARYAKRQGATIPDGLARGGDIAPLLAWVRQTATVDQLAEIMTKLVVIDPSAFGPSNPPPNPA